jgi:large subunit ribosomal protein L2
MEFKRNTALVILPSGVRKVFSVFSIGSIGPVPITDSKYWKNNKAGLYRNFGRKSIVRGVAMNPIDHPNGGRTKSLNYPRTPWGKTTKYK